MEGIPDPPSRCHLLRCLRSLLLAAYYSYASVVAPRRLASDNLLVPRVTQNPPQFLSKWELNGGFWESDPSHERSKIKSRVGHRTDLFLIARADNRISLVSAGAMTRPTCFFPPSSLRLILTPLFRSRPDRQMTS